MSDLMHIGMSALAAYQTALQVVSQNIANADTPYYSRREIKLVENRVGAGVDVADVRRVFDSALNRYSQTSNTDYSQWKKHFEQFASFEQLFDDKNINIGKFINDSLGALEQIGNNFNSTNRSLLMDKFVSLSSQFKAMNDAINKQILNINLMMQNETSQINNLLGSIEHINGVIITANSDTSPELLDEREALVQELAKYFNFTVKTNDNGTVDLTLSNGLSLLGKNPPLRFSTIPDPANNENLIMTLTDGSSISPVNNLITGGELAALINFRSNGLEAARISLDRLGLVFAQKMNQQNKLGIDANANLGTNIFSDINTASLMTSRVVANTNNTGTSSMTVSVDNVSQLNASDYKLSIGTSNNYVLTRLSDNAVVSSGAIAGTFPQTISVDGFTINIASGTFSAGDQYNISPTRGGSDNMTLAFTDPAQLALGWPVIVSSGQKHPGSNGVIKVDSITDTTNAAFSNPKQLNPPIEVRFTNSGGVITYDLYNALTNTSIETGIPYTQGAPLFPTPGNYDPGYQISISGDNIQDGDTFNIQYNVNPVSDNRNAQAMIKLYSSGTVLGGNGLLSSFSNGYELLSGDISSKTNDAKARFDTATNVYKQAEKQRTELSGVSVPDEVLYLSQYQAAYQASAHILQIAQSVFDIITSLARR